MKDVGTLLQRRANVDLSTAVILQRPALSEGEWRLGRPTAVSWLAPSIAGAMFVIYGIGLLIVNLRLARFGASDFEILRPRFVAIGITCVAMTAFSALAVATAWHGAKLFVLDPDVPTVWKCAWIYVCAAWISAPPVLFWTHLGLGVAELWFLYGLAAGIGWFAARTVRFVADPTLLKFKVTRRGVKNEVISGAPRRVFMCGAAVLWLITAFLYLNVYAEVVFPRIGSEFGGGASQIRQFAVAPGTSEQVKGLGVPLVARDVLTQPVRVLFETSGSYVVQASGSPGSVELGKNLVAGSREVSPHPRRARR